MDGDESSGLDSIAQGVLAKLAPRGARQRRARSGRGRAAEPASVRNGSAPPGTLARTQGGACFHPRASPLIPGKKAVLDVLHCFHGNAL